MISRVFSAALCAAACVSVFAVPVSAQVPEAVGPTAGAPSCQSISPNVVPIEMNTIGSQRRHIALVGIAPISYDWASRSTVVRVEVDGHHVSARTNLIYGGGTIIEAFRANDPGTYTVVVKLVQKSNRTVVAQSNPVVVTVKE